MKCPFCGGEMADGRLMADGRSGADLYWMPAGTDVSLWRTRERVEKKGGLVFGQLNSAPSLAAGRCPACKKLIVSYD